MGGSPSKDSQLPERDQQSTGLAHTHTPASGKRDQQSTGLAHTHTPALRKRDQQSTGVAHTHAPASGKRDQQSTGLAHAHTPASGKRDQSTEEASVSRDADLSSDLSGQVSDLIQDQSRCGVCEQALKDPVIAGCGHCVCQGCVGSRPSDPDQPGPCEDQTCPLCSQEMRDAAKQSVVQAYKDRLRRRFKYVSDGGVRTPLRSVYAELRTTEVEREGVSVEHEVWRVESALRSQTGENEPIGCSDIFRPSPGGGGYVKTVMTKGVAGIGKTVSAQKFVLDWADGHANQDIDFVFMLPFRSLNLIEHSWYSLQSLLLELHPELKQLQEPQLYEEGKVLLIFDGLDESRLSLNFEHNYVLCDTNNFSSVDVLVANLIQGNLLPSAHVWITSRPAASKQIPAKYVDRVTEIQGFGEPQKEEYFRKRLGDGDRAREIASHVKACKSLRIMCQVPAVCGVAAVVFPHILDQDSGTKRLPETLTEMFIHFLLRQEQMETEMFEEEGGASREASRALKRGVMVKLSELAFTQLQKGSWRFREDDLRECGIGVGEAAVYSVVFREIFQEEPRFAGTRVFSFTHLSVQEFLAALFVIHCCASKNVEPLVSFLRDTSRDCGEHSGKNRKGVLSSIKHIFEIQPSEGHGLGLGHPPEEGAASLALLKSIVGRVVEISEGHLDHFLRFLVGLCQVSSQELLLGLLPDTSPDSGKAVEYVRALLDTDVAPERCISLLRCLEEVKDDCIHRDLQKYLHSRRPEETQLSPALCSALAHRLLVSEEVLEELDLRSYNTSDKGRQRLIPALRCCRRAVLTGGEIDEKSFETLISALHSLSFPLRELDLSDTDLHHAWTIKLSTQLKIHHCRLETLRLSSCALTDTDCVFLSSVLTSPSSCLRVLDLSGNPLQDKGAMLLSAKVESEHCKLHTLRTSCCGLTDAGCVHLASAVLSPQAALRELDLRGNHLAESTAQTLLSALQEPQCRLHTLRLDHAAVLWTCLGPVQYARELTLDPHTAHSHLLVSADGRRVTHLAEEQPRPPLAQRFQHRPQLLCSQPLSARCYWHARWSQDGVSVGVAYGSIGRKGWSQDLLLGYNAQSWGLFYSHGRCSAWHDKHRTPVPRSPDGTRAERDPSPDGPRAPRAPGRVGVYLDWEAGALSFYSVSSDTLSRLHVFRSAFTEPLYAAFRLRDPDSSLSLCETVS